MPWLIDCKANGDALALRLSFTVHSLAQPQAKKIFHGHSVGPQGDKGVRPPFGAPSSAHMSAGSFVINSSGTYYVH